jgi:hypothetical protein
LVEGALYVKVKRYSGMGVKLTITPYSAKVMNDGATFSLPHTAS